ncbi:MAG: diguanylate cyclase [Thiobacillus sp.]|nr:diguanylate cyclase [Thiobacillus sp.]
MKSKGLLRHRLLFPLATGLGYYLGAVLGVAASSMSEGISIFWLPNGILLAALLMVPRRDWPLYLALAVLAEIAADLPTFTLAQALGFAAVNLFECLLAAWLLQRVARPFRLDRLRHVALFGLVLVFASGLAALLGASIYSLSVPAATSFWTFWMIWWLGDGLGVLLVTPLLLGWLQGAPQPSERRRLEAVALFALTLVFTLWIFSQPAHLGDSFPRRAFLLLPLPLWAAVRFGVRGAASIGLLIAAIAITASVHGLGPLAASTSGITVLLLQEYLAVQAFTSLALAALLQELQDRNERLHIRERAIEAINDGVVIMDARAPGMPIVFANPAFAAMAGRPADELLGRPLFQNEGTGQAGHVAVPDALREGKPTSTPLHSLRQDGTEFWSELRTAPVRDARGQITHHVAIQHDMTEVKRNEADLRAAHDELDRLNRELETRVEARTHELQLANQYLEELASIDHLTGASNRRHFLEQARIEISRAKRLGLALSVIMLDIDFFKSVNDRFGHETGDKVLVALAATIHATLRGGDIFARLGGEEFILMLPGQDLPDAFQMAERLRLLIAQNEGSGCPVPITVSAGVARLEKAADEIDDLLRRADQALYQAKKQGRNQVCVWPFTPQNPPDGA